MQNDCFKLIFEVLYFTKIKTLNFETCNITPQTFSKISEILKVITNKNKQPFQFESIDFSDNDDLDEKSWKEISKAFYAQ